MTIIVGQAPPRMVIREFSLPIVREIPPRPVSPDTGIW
jgi:hypothetical protein